MKSQLSIASLALLSVLCLTLAALPATAQILYDNGPGNGTVNAWSISLGYEGPPANGAGEGKGNGNGNVAAKWNVAQGAAADIGFVTWENPGDVLTSVSWSFTSSPNGGMVYGSGTASGPNLTDSFMSVNEYGYDIDKVTVSGLNVPLNAGTYWLNLQNAQTPSGDPVFWDENSGVGCQSPGCPSEAYASGVGTIPSEAFTIYGSGSSTPEPSSLALFASGVLGLGGLLRKRFLG
jgi:PEP-CTERM motif